MAWVTHPGPFKQGHYTYLNLIPGGMITKRREKGTWQARKRAAREGGALGKRAIIRRWVRGPAIQGKLKIIFGGLGGAWGGLALPNVKND